MRTSAIHASRHKILKSVPTIAEPVARHGPIVMNSGEELRQAFDDVERGTFLHHEPEM